MNFDLKWNHGRYSAQSDFIRAFAGQNVFGEEINFRPSYYSIAASVFECDGIKTSEVFSSGLPSRQKLCHIASSGKHRRLAGPDVHRAYIKTTGAGSESPRV